MTDGLKPWVTVGDAFSDLPEVFPTADSKYKLVSLNIEYPYKTEAQNEYQTLMRSWYGREGFGVSANAFRKNTRDFPIFARMQQGDNYISASRIADELFYEESKLFGYEKDSDNALEVLYGLETGAVYSDYAIIPFDMETVRVSDKNEVRVISDYEELKEWWNNEE